MLAMALHNIAPIESSPLQATELPDPVAGPGGIRVKVKCCAVCRTDLHVIEGDLKPPAMPRVPGHQIVGVIDQLGVGCRKLKVGMRVGIAWLRHACGRCKFCLSGRENLCPDSKYTGYDANGGYAPYATVDENFAYQLPDQFDDVTCSPLLCAGIIGYRSLVRSGLAPGGTLAIFGFGSSAHIISQVALRWGCTLFVVSRNELHQNLARQLGAAWAGSDFRQMPGKADAAIVFAPSGKIIPDALQSLDRGAAAAIAGIHMSAIPALDYDRDLFNERDLRSVTSNTRQDGRSLLEEAAAAGVKPQIKTYPLREANKALQDMKADRIAGTGVLLIDG
jgi:alcohol dehydrogenase, propanol-preferring